MKIPIQEIHNCLLQNYGIQAKIKELPGYEDLNYILDYSGKRSLLKITMEKATLPSVLPQTRILESLNEIPGIKGFIPQVFPSLTGEKCLEWERDGQKVLVRLLSFLEGTFIGDKQPEISFYHDLGLFMGLLDSELAKIDEPIFRGLKLEWDLSNFLELEELSCNISDPFDRTLVEYFFMQNREKVKPVYHHLRNSIIHNDINEWNTLANKDLFAGLIDFGDMVYTATIHELGISMAYCMMNQDDPLAIACEMVGAYNSKYPLLKEEIEILYYLAASRLCTTIVMSAKKAIEEPENEYCQVSSKPAIELLHKWIRINPAKALDCFREACGMDALNYSDKDEMLRERKKHLPRSLSLSYPEPLNMIGAALQYMYDNEGITYLDCVNNIPHTGHCHPRVVAAGQKQMANLNTNTRYLYDSLNKYSEKLLGKFPEKLNKVIFVNSGSAATDLAIRLARTHTGKDQFIVLDNAYHGNTRTAIGLSPYKFNHKGGSGKPSHTHIAPIPNPYRGKYRFEDVGTIPCGRPESHSTNLDPCARPSDIGTKYANEIDRLIAENKLESKLAGFIAESIPGCGGQIMLPKNYLGEVYEKVRALGGVCIADEVQTGFGRVGEKFWGFELYDVCPDIVILGKPMGNGHPIGAVVFTDEIANSFENGLEFFSSFGGNPVSCEIGHAVLQAIEEGKLQENAKDTGEFLFKELLKIQKETNKKGKILIGDVRGSGLFLGLEIVKDLITREPDPETASRIVNEMKNHHVLLSTDGPDENVIKFKPPLCFTKENARELVKKLRLVLEA